MAAVVLTVLVYFGASLASYFVDPFSTMLAYSYTSENAITVDGYVVREDLALDADGDLVYYSRREGERVSKGGDVALLYSSAEALYIANELRSLESQLEQLLYARSLAGGMQSSVSLDAEVNNALTVFHTARASGNLQHMTDAAASVRAAVLRHSYAYTGTEELDQSILALQEEVDAIRASVSKATTTVRAPRSGLFSSLVDGYESVLTPESLTNMTPGAFHSIVPTAAEGVGKLVCGTKWYFVTVLSASDAKSLSKGEQIALRFQSGLDRDVTMKVERISDAENGECLVVLSSEECLNMTTLLRHQSARIVLERYSGIRVPRNAVRIVWEPVKDQDGNPVLNADGSEKKQQVFGVYCMWGNTARFKRVNILWQEDEFMIVESTQAEDPLRRLRAGDQIITAAEDLYDGKVIE